MSALPRPDLPAGPHRDLVNALHDIHHRAGWPSLRALARETGVSHTTVSKTFSAPSLPTWGTLQLLVEALHGETATFHDLWVAASTPPGGVTSHLPRIAGRLAELTAVRRHLETGTGLMLISGEAGIGKTTLMGSAASGTDTFVAIGHCLPLSTQVPLMPIADALRSALALDDGRRMKAALADCPTFVAGEIARLLPELDVSPATDAIDDFGRQRLFSAVTSVLTALSADGRFAVGMEDLHWADPSTLDVLEHLCSRLGASSDMRHGRLVMLGTWRAHDSDTPASNSQWHARIRRMPGSTTLDLEPLTREETAAQLADLGREDDLDAVFTRSRGHPLFTAQLAAHAPEAGLPHALADLLDARLKDLGDAEWQIARTLGIADRPLSAGLLASVAGLTTDGLAAGLRSLDRQRLLGSTGDADRASLGHPLLAEAVRRRLVAGEGIAIHRQLALALATLPDPEPAEIAAHWKLAGDHPQEIGWRVAAARDSASRYDWAQEAEHWLRALALWPEDGRAVGDPPATRATAYLSAMDALNESLQWDRAAAMSDAAEMQLPEADAATRAELLRRAADYRGDREGMAVGMALIDQALEIYDRLPPSNGFLRALNLKRVLLRSVGRYDEARDLALSAADTAALLGDLRMQRHHLSALAWHQGVGGDVPGALETLDAARVPFTDGSDPLGDITQSVNATDLLLIFGLELDAIEAAGRLGLETARTWGIENEAVVMLRANVASARLRAGQVAGATEMIGISADESPDLDRWAAHFVRAAIDAVEGQVHVAANRVDFLWQEASAEDDVDLEALVVVADIHFWDGTADAALPQLLHDLDVVVDSVPVRMVGPALVAAARAAAELPRESGGDSPHRDALRDLYARAGLVPLAHANDANLVAHGLAGVAELARLDGSATVGDWVRAAAAWDRLTRPHDSAYCRWRGAQLALREGQGTIAARLLKRAAVDAREHVPLSRAIAAAR